MDESRTYCLDYPRCALCNPGWETENPAPGEVSASSSKPLSQSHSTIPEYPPMPTSAEIYLAIREAQQKADKQYAEARARVLEELLQVIYDMDASYPDVGRKVSRGEIVKWIEFELGRSSR